MCYSSDGLKTRISSKYTTTDLSSSLVNNLVTHLWNVAGALVSPKGITSHSY